MPPDLHKHIIFFISPRGVGGGLHIFKNTSMGTSGPPRMNMRLRTPLSWITVTKIVMCKLGRGCAFDLYKNSLHPRNENNCILAPSHPRPRLRVRESRVCKMSQISHHTTINMILYVYQNMVNLPCSGCGWFVGSLLDGIYFKMS